MSWFGISGKIKAGKKVFNENESVNAETQEAMDAVAAAKRNLAKTQESGDGDAINAAREILEAAQAEGDTALAGIAGVSKSDTAGMRDDGMGFRFQDDGSALDIRLAKINPINAPRVKTNF